jgi:hypothetical protein
MPRAAASPEVKRIKSAQARNRTAAKRSLAVILDEGARHDAALQAGEVPGDGFLASVLKYEAALAQLRLLDTLADGEPEPEPDDAAGPHPEAVAMLLRFLFSTGLVPLDTVQPETPLGQLVRFAFPDGLPAAAAPAQNGVAAAPATSPVPAPAGQV